MKANWISCEDDLPDDSREVLCTDLCGWFIGCYENNEWTCHATGYAFDSVITHWAELPALPEEDEA